MTRLPRTLYIVGTGGFAKEVAQVAAMLNAHASEWKAIRYISEHPNEAGPLPYGSIGGDDQFLTDLDEEADVAIGVGEPRIRQKIVETLRRKPNLRFPNLIHPRVDIDPTVVRMGEGNFIANGSVLTCDIVLGNHNLINYTATIGHDCRIGSFNVINPGANVAGHVRLEDACLVGTGAQILAHLRIASRTVIGAGAVVTKSIDEPGIYTGIPARKR